MRKVTFFSFLFFFFRESLIFAQPHPRSRFPRLISGRIPIATDGMPFPSSHGRKTYGSIHRMSGVQILLMFVGGLTLLSFLMLGGPALIFGKSISAAERDYKALTVKGPLKGEDNPGAQFESGMWGNPLRAWRGVFFFFKVGTVSWRRPVLSPQACVPSAQAES